MSRSCPSCGHRNDELANFCSSCGERIAGGADDPTAAIPVIEHPDQPDREHLADREVFPEEVGILVVEDGPKAGSRYALDAAVISAGRHPESDIFLDDVTVSRRHVEISHEGSTYTARDVGSLNGTYINKERIDDAVLVDGDELQIGRFKLVFFHGTGTQDA
ncbi:MAG: FHA domain-containing protein [Acidimicrobiales bacterium]